MGWEVGALTSLSLSSLLPFFSLKLSACGDYMLTYDNWFAYLKVPAVEKSTEPSSLVAQEASSIKSADAKDCPKCFSYKERLANCSEELKEKIEHNERLKDDLNKLRAQVSTSKKVF